MKTILFYLSICVFCLSFSKTYAQETNNGTSSTTNSENMPKKGFKYNNNFDVAINIGGGEFASAFSWVKFHGIGKKQKFKIGYGLRLSNYFGADKKYITAPASLTTGRTGALVIFQDNIEKNFDTLSLSSAQVNSLNASINLQYSFSPKFEIGFNIDAIGFSFGGKQAGVLQSTLTNPNKTAVSSTPTTFNALLISDNDLGSLNSEFYARYWVSPKFAIRAGLGFMFTEYTTDKKYVLDNDRYRYKSLMGLIAFTYSPFR